MSYELKKLSNFKARKGPLVFVIMDGIGIGKRDKGDAVHLAQPANLERWMDECKRRNLYAELRAHGPSVGLPGDGDMGNSEVGHNAIGSGQIYSQGAKLVNESILSGRIFESGSWRDVVVKAANNGKTVHLFGLLSDGNVHSHIDQLFLILDGVVNAGVKRIRLHPLLDGRDVAPDSGLEYIDKLEEKLRAIEKMGRDAKIASGGGRMVVTMDRYFSDWNIVKRGWDAHVLGVVQDEEITSDYPGYFKSAREAIETARRVYPEKLDQFNPPFVIVGDDGKPVGNMQDGDAVLNFNFRGDRAIEISQAFCHDDFDAFNRGDRPEVEYAGLLEYDSETHLPPRYLVQPPDIHHVSAQYLCASGISSYAIAETHKFGHVTYFWNGNRTGYVDEKLETYEEVKSLPNEMTETRPEMRAVEVTDKLVEAIQSDKYRFIRVNYANGDMVGHTGNLDSCIRAVRTVDDCLARVVKEVRDKGGVVIITADHGNAEEKFDKKGKPKTSHTLNPVPFMILDSEYGGEYIINMAHIKTPGISSIASTFINLLGFEAPEQYEKSLLEFNS